MKDPIEIIEGAIIEALIKQLRLHGWQPVAFMTGASNRDRPIVNCDAVHIRKRVQRCGVNSLRLYFRNDAGKTYWVEIHQGNGLTCIADWVTGIRGFSRIVDRVCLATDRVQLFAELRL